MAVLINVRLRNMIISLVSRARRILFQPRGG